MNLAKILGAATLTSALLFGTVHAGMNDVVVTMKDQTITYGDVERIVGYQGLWKLQPEQAADANVMISIISRVVRAKVVSEIAKAKGFDKKPEIKEELDMISNDLLAQEFLRREVLEKVEITDADVEQYYNEHKQDFTIPGMIKARHILISLNIPGQTPEEAVQKAKAKAEEALQRIKAGEDFAKVASEMSDDTATKQRGGDLGFFPKGKMVKEFEEAAFMLNKGEVSDPVRSLYGYHIIKVEDKTEEKVQSLAEVKNQLNNKVLFEKKKNAVEQFIENSLKDAGVEVYLDKIQANAPVKEQPVPRH